MNPALSALLITLVLVVFAYFTNDLTKSRYWRFVVMFFFFWLVQWYFSPPVHAYEYIERSRLKFILDLAIYPK